MMQALQEKKWVLIIGLVLVLLGGFVAYQTQTDGGKVTIKDVRFIGTNGTMMSALLYIPDGVSAENPAPGILAIHGYINSRETQDGYAIEFARRGYVVLALDQTGHGYSDPPAFANGFGGPDGLAYLRSLDIVDPDNIGLEGHSMGGWASMAAAATYPDDYKALMLQGSSTGAPFAVDGTAEFPRNFALVFSTWDEFSDLMWGVETATEVVDTDKLQTVFGTDTTVEEGVLYGSIEDGTAREFYQPTTTHPGDHINSAAIAAAMDWMGQTLDGGNGLDPNNQIWQWNELGRLVALIGMVVAMLAFGGMLLQTTYFSDMVLPTPEAKTIEAPLRYVAYGLTMAIPIVSYFWFQNEVAPELVPSATALFSQNITTGIMVWAVGNGLITLALFLVWHFTTNAKNNPTIENYGLSLNVVVIVKSIVFAIVVGVFAYLLLAVSDLVFKTDFRFWVVAVKLMSSLQFRIFLGYLPFFTLFFLILGVALHGQLRETDSVPMWREMLGNVGLLVLGFIAMLLIQYIPLMSGSPLPLAQPLLTIVAFQFVPLLTIVGITMTYFFRKTGTVYAGAFISAIFITWVIVAGQATHYAF